MSTVAAGARRLAVYFFYDPQGVVDEYVVHFLRDLAEAAEEIIVVCNGRLTAEGRDALGSVPGVEVLVRPNTGFDVWAYKAALDHRGWERLGAYDEVVLVNFTIMGPVVPFREVFAEMDARDLDFWGLTVHNGAAFDPWGMMPDGMVPLHLQSHFIAVRQAMVRSPEFQAYWDDMGPITSYIDSVAKHEALFTQRFERMGFRWAAYVDTDDLVDRMFYPLFNVPVELLERRRCPVFKRKTFFAGADSYLDENANRVAGALLDHLTATGAYDRAMLTDHLLRSSHQGDLVETLNRVVVLDDSAPATTGRRVTVVAAVDDLAQASDVLARASGSGAQVLLHVADDDVLAAVEPLVADAGARAVVTPGGPLPWALGADALDTDLVCVLDLRRGPAEFPLTVEDAAYDAVLESVLAGPGHVAAAVRAFDEDPLLGLATPLPAVHARYFGALGGDWHDTFAVVDEALERLDLAVPRAPTKHLVAPVEGAFWVRTAALRPLVDALADAASPWDDASRPASSEREARATAQLLALAVQAAGFLPSYVATRDVAANVLTSMLHYARRLHAVTSQGPREPFSSLEHRLRRVAGVTNHFKDERGYGWTLYLDRGRGLSEDDVLVGGYEPGVTAGARASVDVVLPADVVRVAFDPVEGVGCAARVRVVAPTSVSLTPVASTRIEDLDVFPGRDPRYLVEGTGLGGHRLRLEVEEMHLLGADESVLSRLVGEVESRRATLGWHVSDIVRRVRRAVRAG